MTEPHNWQPIATMPDGELALTTIIDEQGVRNMRRLRKRGRFFVLPDGSTYAYYEPTHWWKP